MASFDVTFFHSEDKFRIIEMDSTGEGGDYDLTFDIGPEATAVAVLIEGEGLKAEISLGDELLEKNGKTKFTSQKGSRTFHTQIAPEGTNLAPRISLRGIVDRGTRVKISIISLFRKFKKSWEPISCTGCKRLLRFLISMLLTGGGLPDIPLDGDIPEEFWKWIQDLNPPEAVKKLLEHLPDELFGKIIGALQWAVAFFNEAYAPFDAVLTTVCCRLGFCADTA